MSSSASSTTMEPYLGSSIDRRFGFALLDPLMWKQKHPFPSSSSSPPPPLPLHDSDAFAPESSSPLTSSSMTTAVLTNRRLPRPATRNDSGAESEESDRLPFGGCTCVVFLGESWVCGLDSGRALVVRKRVEGEATWEEMALLCGHEAPISALCRCEFAAEDALAMISMDGTLSMWETKSFRCVAFESFALSCVVTSMHMLSRTQLLLAGQASHLSLFDLVSFEVTRFSHGHGNWIQAIAVNPATENQSWKVFSAGLDRKVLSWNSPVSPPLCEVTLLESPLHVDVSHDAVLVMTELNWYLYREVDLGVVDHGCLDALKNTDCLSRFSRGFIINESSLLFCTEQSAYLTSRSESSSSFSEKISNPQSPSVLQRTLPTPSSRRVVSDILFSPVTFLASSLGVHPRNSTALYTKWDHSLQTLSAGMKTIDSSSSEALGADSDFVIVGDTANRRYPNLSVSLSEGTSTTSEHVEQHLSLESSGFIDSFQVGGNSSSLQSIDWYYDRMGMLLAGFCTTSLFFCSVSSSGFDDRSKISLSGLRHSDFSCCLLENDQATTLQVALDRDDPVALIGTRSGLLKIVSFSTYETKSIRAHNVGISSMLVLTSAGKHSKHDYCVTGSVTGSVCVWDIKTGNEVTSFFLHSGPVIALLHAPNSVGNKMRNCFCSVGEDRSVVLYSLDTLECLHVFSGHASDVLRLYWRLDFDFFVVKCLMGEVYVWQISTGILERVLVGQRASDVIAQWEGLGSNRFNNFDFASPGMHGKPNTLSGFSVSALPLGRTGKSHIVPVVFPDIGRIFHEIKKFLKKRSELSTSHPLHSMLSVFVPAYLRWLSQPLVDHDRILQTLKLFPEGLCARLFECCVPALRGSGPSITLFLGINGSSGSDHSLNFSSALSSSLLTISFSLMDAFSRLAAGRSSVFMDSLDQLSLDYVMELGYPVPSVLDFAIFLTSSSPTVRNSAWSHLGRLSETISEKESNRLLNQLFEKFLSDTWPLSPSKKDILLVALAVLLSAFEKQPSGQICSVVAHGLMHLCFSPGEFQGFAISVLGLGYHVWQYYIPDTTLFIQELFRLSLPHFLENFHAKNLGEESSRKEKNSPNRPIRHSSETLSKRASEVISESAEALVSIASRDPRLFVETLVPMMDASTSLHHDEIIGVIRLFHAVAERYPDTFVTYLPIVSESIITTLNPHRSTLRDRCMNDAIETLRTFLHRYPMFSFHRASQKVAVGSPNGSVYIFDLQSATKWLVFEAFEYPVSAIAFSDNGLQIASFSLAAGEVRLWSLEGIARYSILDIRPREVHRWSIAGCDPLQSYAASSEAMDGEDGNVRAILPYVELVWIGSEIHLTHSRSKPTFVMVANPENK